MSRLLPKQDHSLDDEIRHHLDECVDLLVSQGWDLEDARTEALRRFGDSRRVRAELVAIGRGGTLASLGRCVRALGRYARHGLRGARRSPVYALSLIATLALGIGAAGAIFAVVDAQLLRPLPYRDADRWVSLHQTREGGDYFYGFGQERAAAWMEAAHGVFDDLVGFTSSSLVRTDGHQAERLQAVAVDVDVGTALGIPLLMGRGFEPADAVPGAPATVILSQSYWERGGADPGVLGSRIALETGPATVVGVLRGGTRFPTLGADRDVWVPLSTNLEFPGLGSRGVQELWGKLPSGVEIEAAQERLEVLAAAMDGVDQSERTWRLRLIPIGASRNSPSLTRPLWILSGTVGVIFLIALVNGVNLVLVRSSARTREFSLRRSLGGSWAALLGQLLTEGMVMGALGGLAGVVVAWAGIESLRGSLPSSLLFFSPHVFEIEGRTVALIVVAASGAGMLLGALPALGIRGVVSRGRPMAPTPEDGRGGRRLKHGLVVGQVALSTALLVMGALLVHSMARLVREDPGFDARRIAVAALSPSPTRYPEPEDRRTFVERLEEALEARPEVDGVAIGTGSGFAFDVALQAEGSPPAEPQPQLIPHSFVSEDYFDVMGMRLTAGRGLSARDAELGNVVVDMDLARMLWGSENPLGRRFRVDEDREWKTVVGVVRELRLLGRDQRPGPYQFLLPLPEDRQAGYVQILMRTSGDAARLLPLFEEVLRSEDPEQWIAELHTAAQGLAQEEEIPRFVMTVMGLLALIAVLLATVGLYGVLAYSVGRRRRELGIRMALGANRARLRRAVLQEGLLVVALGLALGLLGALGASRLVESLLYGLGAMDPVSYCAAAAILLLTTMLASSIPARQATRVDPVQVLNAD